MAAWSESSAGDQNHADVTTDDLLAQRAHRLCVHLQGVTHGIRLLVNLLKHQGHGINSSSISQVRQALPDSCCREAGTGREGSAASGMVSSGKEDLAP